MPKRVKEPVQVYLDRTDRALLDRLAEQTGLSRAELLRRGIRRLADETPDRKPGWSLLAIAGLIEDPDGPTDVSVNHDKYLAQAMEEEAKRWAQS